MLKRTLQPIEVTMGFLFAEMPEGPPDLGNVSVLHVEMSGRLQLPVQSSECVRTNGDSLTLVSAGQYFPVIVRKSVYF